MPPCRTARTHLASTLSVAVGLSFIGLLTPALLVPTAAHADSRVPASWSDASTGGPWVVELPVSSPEDAARMSERFDVWSIDPRRGVVVALVTRADLDRLSVTDPRRVEQATIDRERTRRLHEQRHEPVAGDPGGIPGFPCYRTVAETYEAAEALVAAAPQLATWIDIGDSWEKAQNPDEGWDLFVLRLTQSAVAGPKPSLFASFALHAREYTTAELGTRFAERLVEGYGVDPDVTWLLDHHEVHLLLQGNPDGRTRAEAGALWRKNTNDAYCSSTPDRGADLNRNFTFRWNCCGGSSGDQCSPVYRGPLAASETETTALEAYVRSIFPDQRGPGLDDPAPPDASGVALDIHSFGELILTPWGFTTADAPNEDALVTLGRKLAFFNGYTPIRIRDLTVADGSSVDAFYGELGVASVGYELGTDFFESCDTFESTALPQNLDSLLYAAKAARTPYLTPSGPEALEVSASPAAVISGDLVLVTATADDTRFSAANGSEPSQAIASAAVFVGRPPWQDGAVGQVMAASDGTFDQPIETVEAQIDTSSLEPGRHLLFVEAIDTSGRAGLVGSAFLTVDGTIFVDDFESGGTTAWSG